MKFLIILVARFLKIELGGRRYAFRKCNRSTRAVRSVRDFYAAYP